MYLLIYIYNDEGDNIEQYYASKSLKAIMDLLKKIDEIEYYEIYKVDLENRIA